MSRLQRTATRGDGGAAHSGGSLRREPFGAIGEVLERSAAKGPQRLLPKLEPRWLEPKWLRMYIYIHTYIHIYIYIYIQWPRRDMVLYRGH